VLKICYVVRGNDSPGDACTLASVLLILSSSSACSLPV